MDNTGYLFTAFIIIWVLFFGYLLLLHNRQRRLHREIESLWEALKEKQPDK